MKEARYHGLTVADYIIRYSIEKNFSVSNLKLQKILYFVQAEFLVSKDEPCFDDVIEAWDFGPVVESVYNEYAVHGGNLIFSPSESTSGYHIKHNDRELIDGILEKVKKCSTSYLAGIIFHQTPWLKGRARLNRIITNESLKDFFSE